MEVIPGMPVEHLDARGKVLAESIRNINHCPERKAQIQRELGNISFELWCQYQEGKLTIEEVPGGTSAV